MTSPFRVGACIDATMVNRWRGVRKASSGQESFDMHFAFYFHRALTDCHILAVKGLWGNETLAQGMYVLCAACPCKPRRQTRALRTSDRECCDAVDISWMETLQIERQRWHAAVVHAGQEGCRYFGNAIPDREANVRKLSWSRRLTFLN